MGQIVIICPCAEETDYELADLATNHPALSH